MRGSILLVLVVSLGALGGGAAADPYDDAQAALARHDTAGAMRLFREAADRGDAAAQYNLGQLYSQGAGAPADFRNAALWFGKAANQGNPGAEFNLGRLYQEGRGVRRDKAAAVRWYLKSAGQGYVDAQVRLASMYAKGDGVAEDRAEAAKWYGEAARHGDAGATLDLALIRAQGPIVPQDSIGVGQPVFKESMNRVFGSGQWRETGGYRTIATENRLRAEGALTVPVGVVSRHSMGTPDAPGAYDIVVRGMSPDQAAVKIRRSGIAYRRLFPEGVHGSQGAHLHVEPLLAQLREAIWRRTAPGDRHPSAAVSPAAPPDAKRDDAEALSLLRSAAARGDVCARQALGGRAPSGEASARAYLSLQKSKSCG
ncbi:MAG TPA: tetratricopeptide repeat protein [Caulobacteraceae bacterium]